MTLGEKIKQLITEKGITKAELIRKANVSRSYLRQIIADEHKDVSCRKLMSIARVLDTDVYALLSDTGFKRECQGCEHFWRSPKRKHVGLCHRYPPNQETSTPMSLGWGFPIVNESAWCGEWTPKISEVENETENTREP